MSICLIKLWFSPWIHWAIDLVNPVSYCTKIVFILSGMRPETGFGPPMRMKMRIRHQKRKLRKLLSRYSSFSLNKHRVIYKKTLTKKILLKLKINIPKEYLTC